jgi:hypothetical protein
VLPHNILSKTLEEGALPQCNTTAKLMGSDRPVFFINVLVSVRKVRLMEVCV